jgi:acyl-CoA dehydrogenase
MAWDFETDAEFASQLSWMRSFIDGEIVPLEPVLDELPADEWQVVKRHLQAKVKAQGLWGAFLDPKLGGAGFGQMKLALMSEIIGR